MTTKDVSMNFIKLISLAQLAMVTLLVSGCEKRDATVSYSIDIDGKVYSRSDGKLWVDVSRRDAVRPEGYILAGKVTVSAPDDLPMSYLLNFIGLIQTDRLKEIDVVRGSTGEEFTYNIQKQAELYSKYSDEIQKMSPDNRVSKDNHRVDNEILVLQFKDGGDLILGEGVCSKDNIDEEIAVLVKKRKIEVIIISFAKASLLGDFWIVQEAVKNSQYNTIMIY